jgi:predicted glycoside hydrolase/deacetylase ChbG (UPF0249 family)
MKAALIVNADDYGRTPEVSAGIRQAHLHGIVSTTTAMVNMPGAVDQLKLAMEECPEIGIGVHLNLTIGPPSTPIEEIPSLINSRGHFLSRSTLMQSPDHIDPSHAEIEFRSQIHSFLATGGTLDHLDSHHHIVALNPSLWEIYLELAEEFDCGVRPSYPSDVYQETLFHTYPSSVLDFSRYGAMEKLEASGLTYPDHFLASFFGPGANLENLLSLLEELPHGICELMCHPGNVDTILLSESGYAKEREIELVLLTHPKVKQTVLKADIRLCTYRNAWNH